MKGLIDLFKKICSLILAISCIFSVFPSAHAKQENNTVLTVDDNLIAFLTEEAAKDVPSGYTLESVDIDIHYNNINPIYQENDVLDNEPRGLLYKIENVRHTTEEFMLTDGYESDYFYGPCTINETYTKSSKACLNCSVTIGKSTLKGALGFSFTQEYSNSKSFNTTVAAGKYLHLRTYVVYRRSDFDVRNIWTGEIEQQNAWAGKPVGLAFFQATYTI